MQAPADAYWIGSAHPFDLHEAYLDFRRDITLIGQAKKARIFITADSRYRLWINGRAISYGPARCWPHAQQVDFIDVAAALRAGRNAIAVQVYSPGYSHFAYVHRGVCGLLAWLAIDDVVTAATDASWQVRRNSSWAECVPRVSIYGSGVEQRSLVLDDDWQDAPAEKPAWHSARIVAPAESPLWHGLRERDVPLLGETIVALSAPRFFREGALLPKDSDPHEALRQAWFASEESAPPDLSKPVNLPAAQSLIWVFDLGESRICHAEATFDDAAGNETLLVSYAEKLQDGGVVLSDPSTYCRMRPTDVFQLRKGKQTASSFSQRGGRYLIFCLNAPTGGALSLQFAARVTDYPLPSSYVPLPDPTLGRIQDLCRRTLRNCLQDGFVDGVWRESSQWLGDCVPQAFALLGLSDDLRPLRRAIVMAAEGAYSDGVLPSVLPGEVPAYTVTDYNFSWIELLDLYCQCAPAQQTGELLAQQLPVLARMFGRFAQDEDKQGLLAPQPGRRLFLDWSSVARSHPNLTYNGRYLFALILAGGLAARAGNGELASSLNEKAQHLRAALRSTFCGNDEWLETPAGTPASQLALALLALTDSVTGEDAARLADRIVARSLDFHDAGPHKLVLASPFMHHYIFLALDHLGRWTDIEAIIRARWGQWANAGEATAWENWNVDFPDGSVCHGFSAHPLRWLQISAAHGRNC